jgi:23S rRNA (adenine1618-N6)-methyltransferase
MRWIQDLVDSTTADITSDPDASRQVIGIDIGVGSSCIYPLLGCASRPTWHFYGTEVDDTNYIHAVYNVTNNDLDSRIHLTKTLPEGPLLPLHQMAIKKADFTMCNPPFFGSRAEMKASLDKNIKPSAVCTGADVEMIVEGGEVKYVLKMVEESKVLGERVQWYTSQLGKLSTVPIIIEKLKELQCVNWAMGVLNPNEVTRRWVIGWSWGDMRPANVSTAMKSRQNLTQSPISSHLA